MTPNPVIMLPTYNEADNIRAITQGILSQVPSATVIIVDDDSPDGTGRIADEMAQADARVRVIHRLKDRGRGYAGAEGFRACVAEGFDPIIEMDADFSHDPAYLPQMLSTLEGCDIVIGSRGVSGGGESGRGIARRFITWGARAYLRIMVGVKGVSDLTSGFRCFRRHVLESIDLETLTSPGPGIVTEVLYRCRKFRIKEIPIRFRDREHGESKFGMKAMAETLLLALRLRLKGR